MSRSKILLSALLLALGVTVVIFAVPAAANHPAGHPVTVCHMPGTPAEQTMTLPTAAVPGHLGHGDTLGPCAPPPPPTCAGAVDICIDADGFTTPGTGLPGAAETLVGDVLTTFPITGVGALAGLDGFDNDLSGSWTLGDDLHAEDPAQCPGAIRNAVYNLGLDCVVLDLDGSFFDLQPVTCDLEFAVPFITACDPLLKYRDGNSDGIWQSGEDIVLDVNGNGVFD